MKVRLHRMKREWLTIKNNIGRFLRRHPLIRLVVRIVIGVAVIFIFVYIARSMINQPINQSINQSNQTIKQPGQKNAESLIIVQVDNRYGITVDEGLKIKNWTTEEFKWRYWDQTAVINKRYADEMGYDYLQIKSDSVSNIEKVKKMNEFMQNRTEYDWILFLDSDAYVSRNDWDFEAIRKRFNVTEEFDMAIEHEPVFRQKLYAKLCNESNVRSDSVVNTGVYLLRNSEIGRGIMTEWLNAISKFNRLKATIECDDQRSLNCGLPTKAFENYAKHIKILNTQYFANIGFELKSLGGYTDAWIQHVVSANMDARYKNSEIRKHIMRLIENDNIV